jgi:hypothetical protein
MQMRADALSLRMTGALFFLFEAGFFLAMGPPQMFNICVLWDKAVPGCMMLPGNSFTES